MRVFPKSCNLCPSRVGQRCVVGRILRWSSCHPSRRLFPLACKKPLAEEDSAFLPYAELSPVPRYDSILLGEDYATDIEEVCSPIRRGGARKAVLALSSHGIRPNAKGIRLKTDWLERMLQTALEAGVIVVGVDYFR